MACRCLLSTGGCLAQGVQRSVPRVASCVRCKSARVLLSAVICKLSAASARPSHDQGRRTKPRRTIRGFSTSTSTLTLTLTLTSACSMLDFRAWFLYNYAMQKARPLVGLTASGWMREEMTSRGETRTSSRFPRDEVAT